MTYTSRLGSIVIEVPVTTETPPSWGRWRFTEGGRYLNDQQITQQRLEGLLWRATRWNCDVQAMRPVDGLKKRFDVGRR